MLLQGRAYEESVFPGGLRVSVTLLRVLRKLLAIGEDKLAQMQKRPAVLGAIAN